MAVPNTTHLVLPLSAYYLENPNTYIVHITDVLLNFTPRLGRLFKTSHANHLALDNSARSEGWEEYDLKPKLYFYLERDFLGGWWTSEKTKEMLHDGFPGEIKLMREVYNGVLSQLGKDSEFLCSMEAIDYSLFTLRRKCGEHKKPGTRDERVGISIYHSRFLYEHQDGEDEAYESRNWDIGTWKHDDNSAGTSSHDDLIIA
jgi:Phosphatidylinositol-4-phosphate 5-Kinase